MIDKTHDVGLVVPMDIVPSYRLRDLLEALMLILPKQFGHLHSRCSRHAQNIENSYCIAMMEAVNGAKDLNVFVIVPAIEGFITSVSEMRSFAPAIINKMDTIPKGSTPTTMLRLFKGQSSTLSLFNLKILDV